MQYFVIKLSYSLLTVVIYLLKTHDKQEGKVSVYV